MLIDHPILAYYFDEAVGTFGMWVENKLDERDKKGKPKHRLPVLLGEEPEAKKITLGQAGLLMGGDLTH